MSSKPKRSSLSDVEELFMSGIQTKETPEPELVKVEAPPHEPGPSQSNTESEEFTSLLPVEAESTVRLSIDMEKSLHRALSEAALQLEQSKTTIVKQAIKVALKKLQAAGWVEYSNDQILK